MLTRLASSMASRCSSEIRSRAFFDNDFIGRRIDDIRNRHTTEHALGQRRNHLTGINHGGNGNAVFRAAIIFIDDAILRHIDQTPRQITGVGRFQSRIGQDLYAHRGSS